MCERTQQLESEVLRLQEVEALALELNREHVDLKNKAWLLEEQVRILDEQLQAMPTASPVLYREQLIEMRDRIVGNWRVAKAPEKKERICRFAD